VTTIISNNSVRLISLGMTVARATATLPATASGNIFTVTGGRIIIVSLIGEVTTAVQNQACTLAIGYAPTVGTGSTTNLGTASSIIAAPVGTHFGFNPGGAVATDLSTQAGVSLPAAGILVDAGAVQITTSATNTGSVKWDIAYIPYDSGAQVAAA
jgi:hypothetical protein